MGLSRRGLLARDADVSVLVGPPFTAVVLRVAVLAAVEPLVLRRSRRRQEVPA